MAPRQDSDPGDGPPPREQDRAAGPSAAELEDRWLRAVAELDNLRKRHARELESVRAEERRRVSAAWLPVLDHLDAALEHADADPESIVEGVRAVRDQAVGLLAGLGYPRDEELGVPFDPRRHEVVSVVRDPDAEPGTVVGMLRPGYGEAGHQLRPGAVAVAGEVE
jgi:molecular chaperone GrpE